MSKFYKVLLTVLLLAIIATGTLYFFKGNVLDIYDKFYNNFGENLQNFNKTDLGNIVSEIKKEIFTPPPLNIGGESNQVVLVRAKVIAQTNIQRYDNGALPPLSENAKLDAAALSKANDLFKNQYFEHVSPSGVDPGELVKNFGYDYIVAGENLILGNFKDEKEAVQLWMDSPGHRANILNNRFTEIGVAIIKGTYKGQTVWIGVQEFGLPLSSCAELNINLKSQINLNQNKLDQLSLQIDAKKDELEGTNKRSSQYNTLVDKYNQLVAQYNSLNQETKSLIAQYNSQVNVFNQCVAGN